MLYPTQTLEHIKAHIASLPETKSNEINMLHQQLSNTLKNKHLWFDDGLDEQGKIITNPIIGYGMHLHQTAKGKTKELFQVGLSANSTGISIYIIGLKDKTLLNQFIGDQLGKAKVTGYCIKFKSIQDINLNVLIEAILFAVGSVQ